MKRNNPDKCEVIRNILATGVLILKYSMSVCSSRSRDHVMVYVSFVLDSCGNGRQAPTYYLFVLVHLTPSSGDLTKTVPRSSVICTSFIFSYSMWRLIIKE